jgi:2-methylcitrate dehydratase PrpD
MSMLVEAPKGSPGRPFEAAEHEARFTQELSTRVSAATCADIIAMAKNLDSLDPRWLCRALSGE